MNYTFSLASAAEAPKLSALVQLSFSKIAASSWEPHAQKHFLAECSPENLAAAIASATYAAAAYESACPVGFILLSRPNLVYMLFVHPEHLRRGIARQLWEQARSHVEATHPEARTVELNATPVALLAYQALGFYPISPQVYRNGCRTTRMACWLPALHLPRDAP